MNRFTIKLLLGLQLTLQLSTAHAVIKNLSGDVVMSSDLAIGKTTIADSKSILDLVSTTKGMLAPRMTTTQRDAISSPPTGLTIYNTSTNAINVYTGSAWVAYVQDPTIATGDVLYRSTTGSIDRKAPGTSGQYFTTQGPAAGPIWSTFTQPTVQVFTSGSGTYTTPANVKSLRVLAIGGGGGGAGSSSSAGNGGDGAAGSTTLFGSVAHVLGGVGGNHNAGSIAAGGAPTINSPGITLFAVTGGSGGGASNTGSATTIPGGQGGSSCLGGAGGAGGNVAGTAGVANTGGGGGGGGTPGSSGNISGGGGGSGGCAMFRISAPLSSYSYNVGAGSTAGSAGTSGQNGAAGGAGLIVVEEFYQ